MPSTTAPSACRHCGIGHREHMQQWTQPTQQQIKQRTTVRRNARTAPS